MNPRIRVYIDPNPNQSLIIHPAPERQYTIAEARELIYRRCFGGPRDCGLFYCPYVPLQMFKGKEPFKTPVGFKTRYGGLTNPFVT
jgi:hypothetical protein